MPELRIAIHGAAGRMGRQLVALAAADPELAMAAALESAGHPRLGDDAGNQEEQQADAIHDDDVGVDPAGGATLPVGEHERSATAGLKSEEQGQDAAEEL